MAEIDIRMDEFFFSVVVSIEDYTLEVLLDYINPIEIRETSFVLHEHTVHELYYMEKGSMKLACEGEKYTLQEGDIFIIKARDSHRIISCSDDIRRFHIRFKFCGEQNGDDAIHTQFIPAADNEHFHTYVEALRKIDMNSIHNFSMYRIKSNIGLLLCDIFEKLSIRNCSSQSQDFLRQNKLIKYSIIDSFFGANCSKQVTINDLAEYLKYSKMQTHRIVVECCGMSFSQKLREVRIRTAKHLLLTSDLSIDEIASRCGYETRIGFENAFFKRTQMMPSKYRQSVIDGIEE